MENKDKVRILLAIGWFITIIAFMTTTVDLNSQLSEANVKIEQLESELNEKEIELQQVWKPYQDFTCAICGFDDDVETILFEKSYHIKCHRCNYQYDITTKSLVDYTGDN